MIYLLIYDTGTSLRTYCGYTGFMTKRIAQHRRGSCKTTSRYNKAYTLKEIRYVEGTRTDEASFKKLSQKDKLRISKEWDTWLHLW